MSRLLMAGVITLLSVKSYSQVLVTNFVSSNDAAVWYRTDNASYGSAITGSDIDMDVYCTPDLIGAYAYIQFDLSELGTNATVVSASLELTKVDSNPLQSFAGVHSTKMDVITADRFACYGLNSVAGNTSQDWSETSLSFNSTGDELTEGSAHGIDPFNAADGRSTDLSDVESISGDGTEVTVSGEAVTAFVQSRLDDDGLVTFMIDLGYTINAKGFAFNTRDSGLAGAMPVLTLNYTAGEPLDPNAVLLVDNGGTATLMNGEVSAVLDKSNGQIVDLRKGESANLLANGGYIYYTANGSVGSSSGLYVEITPDTWEVVTNTPQRVEVSLIDTNMLGCRVELHYALREGASGLDFFTVWEHGPGDPEVSLGQLRWAIRCDPNLFTMAYAGPEKTGQMIDPALLASAEEIMDATLKLPMISTYTNETGYTYDGYPVYTKYDWSQYTEDHHVHGVAGDAYGLWLVMGSMEYCNGGPTKAYQTVHGTATTPIFMWLGQSTHKGASPINLAAGEEWSKIFGPAFLYVNEGTNAASLWADAQVKADAETAAWPPSWMENSGFPLQRGTITGRLHVLGQSTSNALVVLSAPGEYWQTVVGKAYQFWTRAEADGSFTLPKVRPGNYSLYAEVPGVVGIMQQTNVTVTEAATNDLGTVEWEPARYEQRLFRLGMPDLSAAEFRFGAEMRQYGLWWRYQEEQGTNDLDFVIGVSDPATDWYYALSLLPVEITPTNGTWVTPKWNIHFNVDEIPPAPVRLSVELAGAITGAFYVFVNGVNICPNTSAGIYTVNDSGIYRSTTDYSCLQRYELTFDPNLLSLGTNTISFTVRGTGSSGNPWNGTRPVLPAAGIMFDCIQLEAGELKTNGMPHINKLEVSGAHVILEGEGGFPATSYNLLEKYSLISSNWIPVSGHVFTDTGAFTLTNETISESGYYLLEIP